MWNVRIFLLPLIASPLFICRASDYINHWSVNNTQPGARGPRLRDEGEY